GQGDPSQKNLREGSTGGASFCRSVLMGDARVAALNGPAPGDVAVVRQRFRGRRLRRGGWRLREDNHVGRAGVGRFDGSLGVRRFIVRPIIWPYYNRLPVQIVTNVRTHGILAAHLDMLQRGCM